MDHLDSYLAMMLSRRRLLAGGAVLGAGATLAPALADMLVSLPLASAPTQRPTTSAFPGKGDMILQRARPPLLETPISVFERDIFTPNDRFYVRWHWADIPTSIDVETFRLTIHGHVRRPLSISLAQLLRMPRIEMAAINQCSGNSRGLFKPRVPGAQWAHGAMGNARWLGVPLRHLLDLADIHPGAVAVRFGALDSPLATGAPDFEKALTIDHARNGEVMLAFGMNGEQLPLLNGFPLRLVVPGWFSTYWIKMLDQIEVLPAPDDGYWMTKAYRVPDTPGANVAPGAKNFPTVPISRMIPRSWVTSLQDSQTIAYASTIPVGGIAMGGDCGVARIDVSSDGGLSWHAGTLGPDMGRYSFRRWDAMVPVARSGRLALMSRCTNVHGEIQPMIPIWNPGGFMRNNVETTTIVTTRQ